MNSSKKEKKSNHCTRFPPTSTALGLPRQNGEIWNAKPPLCREGPILWMSIIWMLLLGLTTGCNADDSTLYANGNISCIKCLRGTFVSEHCKKNVTRSKCTDCPDGTFQDKLTRHEQCRVCHKTCLHDENMVLYKQCNTSSDMICRCKEGYYEKILSTYSDTRDCEKHRKCADDEYIVKKGDSANDTQCAKCSRGTFLNVTSGQCQRCQVCPDSTPSVSPCQGQNDTRCDTPMDNQGVTPGVLPVYAIVLLDVFLPISVVGVSLFLWWLLVYRKRLKNNSGRKISYYHRYSTVKLDPKEPEHRPQIPTFRHLTGQGPWIEDVFNYLSGKIDPNDWKPFIRRLKTDNGMDHEISTICVNNPNDVKEQIYQSLKSWNGMQQRDFDLKDVFNAISDRKNINIFSDLKNYCSELDQKYKA